MVYGQWYNGKVLHIKYMGSGINVKMRSYDLGLF